MNSDAIIKGNRGRKCLTSLTCLTKQDEHETASRYMFPREVGGGVTARGRWRTAGLIQTDSPATQGRWGLFLRMD